MISVVDVQGAFGGLFENVPNNDVTRAIRIATQFCPPDIWGIFQDDGILMYSAFLLSKWREESLKLMASSQQVSDGQVNLIQGDSNTEFNRNSNYFYQEWQRLRQALPTITNNQLLQLGLMT